MYKGVCKQVIATIEQGLFRIEQGLIYKIEQGRSYELNKGEMLYKEENE